MRTWKNTYHDSTTESSSTFYRTMLFCTTSLCLLASCQSTIRFSSTVPSQPQRTPYYNVPSARAYHAAERLPAKHPIQHEVINIAEQWLGTSYKYGTASTATTDCSGFVMQVYAQAGVMLPRSTRDQFSIGKSIARDSLELGDLLFFNTSGKGVSHVGLYAGEDNVIHASSKSGVVRQSLSQTYLHRTFLGARRVIL